jgi:hypothetical protein
MMSNFICKYGLSKIYQSISIKDTLLVFNFNRIVIEVIEQGLRHFNKITVIEKWQ